MRAEDLTVTVRDKTLVRKGVIPSHLLEATFIIRDTAVGDWKLRLPADHPMAALLRTPGYGIIVDGPDGTLFSGPMVKSTRDSDYRDESGIVTVEGVTDEIVLWDALAYPPADFAYDTFTGEPWEIFDHFIDFNLGDLDRFPLGSFGSLLTTDFSAVDGTGGANLVPNPLPTSPATGWSASETYAFEADFAPNGYEDSFYSYILGTTPTYIWPVPGGTDAIAVTPAASYDVGCYTYTNYAAETAVGVTWYDAAGTSLSTDMGTTVTMTYYAAGTWEYSGSPYWGWEAEPSGTFTAPAGAAYGRPFCITTGDDPYSAFVNVAVFTMVAA